VTRALTAGALQLQFAAFALLFAHYIVYRTHPLCNGDPDDALLRLIRAGKAANWGRGHATSSIDVTNGLYYPPTRHHLVAPFFFVHELQLRTTDVRRHSHGVPAANGMSTFLVKNQPTTEGLFQYRQSGHGSPHVSVPCHRTSLGSLPTQQPHSDPVKCGGTARVRPPCDGTAQMCQPPLFGLASRRGLPRPPKTSF
jgi:hypothetical protein